MAALDRAKLFRVLTSLEAPYDSRRVAIEYLGLDPVKDKLEPCFKRKVTQTLTAMIEEGYSLEGKVLVRRDGQWFYKTIGAPDELERKPPRAVGHDVFSFANYLWQRRILQVVASLPMDYGEPHSPRFVVAGFILPYAKAGAPPDSGSLALGSQPVVWSDPRGTSQEARRSFYEKALSSAALLIPADIYALASIEVSGGVPRSVCEAPDPVVANMNQAQLVKAMMDGSLVVTVPRGKTETITVGPFVFSKISVGPRTMAFSCLGAFAATLGGGLFTIRKVREAIHLVKATLMEAYSPFVAKFAQSGSWLSDLVYTLAKRQFMKHLTEDQQQYFGGVVQNTLQQSRLYRNGFALTAVLYIIWRLTRKVKLPKFAPLRKGYEVLTVGQDHALVVHHTNPGSTPDIVPVPASLGASVFQANDAPGNPLYFKGNPHKLESIVNASPMVTPTIVPPFMVAVFGRDEDGLVYGNGLGSRHGDYCLVTGHQLEQAAGWKDIGMMSLTSLKNDDWSSMVWFPSSQASLTVDPYWPIGYLDPDAGEDEEPICFEIGGPFFNGPLATVTHTGRDVGVFKPLRWPRGVTSVKDDSFSDDFEDGGSCAVMVFGAPFDEEAGRFVLEKSSGKVVSGARLPGEFCNGDSSRQVIWSCETDLGIVGHTCNTRPGFSGSLVLASTPRGWRWKGLHAFGTVDVAPDIDLFGSGKLNYMVSGHEVVRMLHKAGHRSKRYSQLTDMLDQTILSPLVETGPARRKQGKARWRQARGLSKADEAVQRDSGGNTAEEAHRHQQMVQYGTAGIDHARGMLITTGRRAVRTARDEQQSSALAELRRRREPGGSHHGQGLWADIESLRSEVATPLYLNMCSLLKPVAAIAKPNPSGFAEPLEPVKRPQLPTMEEMFRRLQSKEVTLDVFNDIVKQIQAADQAPTLVETIIPVPHREPRRPLVTAFSKMLT